MRLGWRPPRRWRVASYLMLSATLSLAGIVRAADGLWTQLPPPEYRLSGSAVYDRVRHRMILFGGINGFEERNDVWVLELSYPNQWRRLLPAGTPPSARRLHCAVYDSKSDRMIVFAGGFYTNRWYANNEVWALELAGEPHWVQLHPTGTPPAARVASVAVFDALRNQILVHGGAFPDGSLLGDVWKLSLNGTPAWTQVSPNSTIGPRAYAVAIADSVRDRMVIMGGSVSGQSMSDTWVVPLWSGTAWTELTTIGTPPTAHSLAGAYDPVHDQMVVFGGFNTSNGQYLQGAKRLRFDTATPTWVAGPTAGAIPPPGLGQVAIYDPIADAMRVFGGWGGNAASISQNAWTLWMHPQPNWGAPLAANAPTSAGRYGACVAFDAANHRMFMFGGANNWAPPNPTFLNDVWVLDLGVSPVWSPITPTGTPPAARAFASLVYDPSGNRVVLYGGEGNGVRYGDAWQLSLTGPPAWTQLLPSGTPPIARSRHGSIYDPIRDRMVMFGGSSLVSPYYQADAWALSLSGAPAWTPLTPSGRGPTRRHGISVTLDSARDRMLLFGGLSDTPPILNRDAWALNLAGGTAWDSIEVAVGPTGRREHEGVYDPVHDQLIVFGGYADVGGGGMPSNDLWTLSLAGSPTWTSRNPAGLLDPLAEQAAIYDPVNDRLVSYGGVGALNSTWIYQPSAVLAAPPPGLLTHSDASVSASPNPSRGAIELSFAMPVAGRARLEVFDVSGRRIAQLLDTVLPAGSHHARWDGTVSGHPAPAGVYLARLSIPGARGTLPLMRIR